MPRAIHLRDRLDLTLHAQTATIHKDVDYMLHLSSSGLALHALKREKHAPVRLDFTEGRSAHRRLYGGGKSQLLAKACAIKKANASTVIDATAGFGSDAFVLASLGLKVVLIERNPIIGALLEDAILRASHHPTITHIAQNMQLHIGQATDLIPQLQRADIIYLDPMYPPQKKSALVKKELRMIRDLVGDDEDSETLFNTAYQHAAKVVVKRAKSSPPISSLRPDHTYEGQRSRFDVYATGHAPTI